MKELVFWYEFASTYSYLSAERIAPLAAARGVTIVWRPFLLGPIFQAQGWQSSPFNIYPAKGAYMWQDMDRRAAKYGLPDVTRPDPFPQHTLLAARLATLGLHHGWTPDFTRAVYRAEFAEGRGIHDEAILSDCLRAVGVDPAPTIDQARTDQTVKDALRATTEAAAEQGLFGAPSFTTADGTLYWGDDRLEDALEAA